MTILITGGAGFIGLNLLEELTSLGKTLIILSPSNLPLRIQQAFAQKNIFYENVQGKVD